MQCTSVFHIIQRINSDASLNIINQIFSEMETHCIFFEMGTEHLNI
jgi:hypothetical protein